MHTSHRRHGAFFAATLLVAVLAVPSLASAAPYVVIDPGHGGIYNHARLGRVREKNINLAISLEVARQLRAAGYQVALTRTNDATINVRDIPTWGYDAGTGLWAFRSDGRRYGDPPLDDLQARVDLANTTGADVFISIHNNGARSRRANGTETWASPRDLLGISLGRYIQTADVQQTRLRNRGAKRTDFYVLRWSNMPAVLIEGAFISNYREARLLSNSKFRSKLARGIVIGLQRWLATNPYKPLLTRYAGDSPADVAVAASRAGWPSGATSVLLASSADPRDALAAAPLARVLGAPILFADSTGLSAATCVELARLRPTSIVVVGETSLLPASVLTSASAAAGLAPGSSRRIVGADHFETAALLATEAGTIASGTVVISSGDSGADLVSAAAYSAATGAPLLLSAAGSLPAPTITFLAAHAAEITRTIVVGGESAVTSETAAGLVNVTRFADPDAFANNAALMRSAVGTSAVTGLVVSPASAAECLVAISSAARARVGAVLLNEGRIMSPFTRRFIVNSRGRPARYVVVGGFARQPVLVDWMVDKATH